MQVNGIQGILRFFGVQNAPSPSTTEGRSGRERSDISVNSNGTLSNAGEPNPSNRDLLLNAQHPNVRRVPSLEIAGPLGGFRSLDVLRVLTRKVESETLPFVNFLNNGSRAATLKSNRIDSLKASLEDLAAEVADLQKPDALSARAVRSSDTGRVRATAGSKAPISEFSVTPTRLSENNVLYSDQQATLDPLGLTGSFFVNGYEIAVVATDSLAEIRDKINFGEDVNKNGILDGAEDIDANGVLETLRLGATEAGPGKFFIEDFNGNGSADLAEDTNDNKRLDGGTAQNQVAANILKNRLVLTSTAGGEIAIDLRDDDGILLALGFFELNIKGVAVQKEQQFTDGFPPVDLIQLPRTAEANIAGETVQSTTNQFDGAGEDTTVTLQKAPGDPATIIITLDIKNVQERINRFADLFNETVSVLNDLLAGSRIFARDLQIQDLRNDLTAKTQEKTKELDLRNRNADAVNLQSVDPKVTGISVANAEKDTVHEVSAVSALDNIRRGLTLSAHTGGDLFNRLSSFGIRTLADDTFKLDPVDFEKALQLNTDEVLNVFLDETNGVFPLLSKQLDRILNKDLGDLALKQTEVSALAETPNFLAEKFRKFRENSNFSSTVQNLIAVA
ncbi:MAG: hypothetical protein COV67_15215 [Nitrospinae bacterium CG11_big_fil_rev_8_21_14_0_20_56_8]|nr:MAG: hypothetical protein COV67_15215 [Nitrospinae bacterium CG11_big_fil_rev_8_21_14_0_20_56_8]